MVDYKSKSARMRAKDDVMYMEQPDPNKKAIKYGCYVFLEKDGGNHHFYILATSRREAVSRARKMLAYQGGPENDDLNDFNIQEIDNIMQFEDNSV